MLWRSSRQFLTAHPAQLLLALAGIAAGVAVMTGVGLLRGVLLESLDRVDQALMGEGGIRVVSTTGTLPEARFVELMRTAGAPEMVPVLSRRVQVAGEPLELIGTDPWMARNVLGFGGATDGPATLMATEPALVVSHATASRLGLNPDAPLLLRYRGQVASIAWTAMRGLPPALDDRLLADISTVQDLTGTQGQLSHILAPGDADDWLAENLPRELTSVSAADRHARADRLTAGMRANLGALSGLAMGVGLFVVFSVLSFLFVQRRRSFAVLRAVGVRPGQLGWLMVREAAFLGALGVLLGLALGTWLAGELLALVREPLADLYQNLPGRDLRPSPWLYPGIGLLALAACLVAVLPVAREALRVPAGRLLNPASPGLSDRFRGGAAGVLVLIGGGLVLVSQGVVAALVATFLLLGGVALLVPLCARGLLVFASRLPGGGLWRRGLGLLQAGQARVGPALSALALAVAVTAGTGMMIASFRISVDEWVTRLLQADTYLTLEEGVIGEETARQVDGMDQVVHVSSARRVVLANGWNLVAYDLPPPAWEGFEWLETSGDNLPARFAQGVAVIVSEPFARRHGIRAGDSLDFDGIAGLPGMEVAGVFRDYTSDQGYVGIAGPVWRQRSGDDTRDSLGLYFSNTMDPDTERIERAIQDATGLEVGGIRLTTPASIRNQTLSVFDQTFRITRAMQLLVGLIALVALVSALLALALERARDYATLRALGLTRFRLGMLVTGQTLGLAAIAGILAMPVALALHALLSGVIQPRSFGWTLPWTWPVAELLAVLPWVLICGFLAGLYPAWKIARRDPVVWLKERY